MTGATLKTMVESILDDETVGDTFFYQILNVVRVIFEEERAWRYIIKENSSFTTAGSDTYTTTHALPSDFSRDYKVSLGDDDDEIDPIPFEERNAYRTISGYYYIDLLNSVFALTGTNTAGKTIRFFYLHTPSDITSTTSPIFPSRFHPILAYRTAAYIQAGPELEDMYAKMSAENRLQAILIERAMVLWDTNIKLRTMNHSFGPRRATWRENTIYNEQYQ